MRLLIGSIGLFAAVLLTAAESAYLPRVGPPALRFESPRVEAETPAVPLPPLAPTQAVPITLPESGEKPTSALTLPSTPTTPAHDESTNAVRPVMHEPKAAPEPAAPQPGLPAPPLETAQPGNENLTPQMFMKFFTGRPGTNQTGSSVTLFAPLPFIPPVPPTPPSSSASYQTTPAPAPAPKP